MDSYIPSKKILENYAKVLVNYALNSGEGIKEKEVVFIMVPDVAKSLALELRNQTLKSGAIPMLHIIPTGFDADFYNLANEYQLKFFPDKYLKERVNLMDHTIRILADPDPSELSKVDPSKILMSRDAANSYREWTVEKETMGKFTWTLGLWGVPAKAHEVGLTIEEYWDQIIQACFLDKADPVKEWKKIQKMQYDILEKLNSMKIKYVVMTGKDVDLKITLGEDRIWKGGSGRNIPSFEFFTSPDWRGVEGWIKFNQPLYRYGQIIKDVYFEIKNGRIVKATAKKGNKFVQEMLKSKNADKIGEYSLTDKRMSRITHVMAETLFDENIGGPYGNTHLAIGMAYKDCYRGDPSILTKKDWEAKGYNDSPEHTDIISTTDRTVTAFLTDGTSKIIYKDGQFVI